MDGRNGTHDLNLSLGIVRQVGRWMGEMEPMGKDRQVDRKNGVDGNI